MSDRHLGSMALQLFQWFVSKFLLQKIIQLQANTNAIGDFIKVDQAFSISIEVLQ